MTQLSKCLIDGEWRDASAGTHPIINPATEERLADGPACSAVDAAEAALSAQRAQPAWESTPFAERSKVLERAAESLEAARSSLEELVVAETGMAVRNARPMQVDAAIRRLRWYSQLDEDVLRFDPQPRPNPEVGSSISRAACGVVAAISPYNFPLLAMVGKVAPALLAGNTVVMKPAPQDPLAIGILADAFQENGAPPGVVNLVGGPDAEVGRELVRSGYVNLVSFTGSTIVGQDIYRNGADGMKRMILELGGKAACIVLDDADLDRAASTLARVWSINSGQVCLAPTRAVVHRSVRDELIERLIDIGQKLIIGDPTDESTDMGPIISSAQLEKISSSVERARNDGGDVVLGGQRLDRAGWYYPPTLVADCNPGSWLDQNEVFGPVIAVAEFDSEDDAVSIANGTPYGLHDYVFSVDVDRAKSVAAGLHGASVSINGPLRHPEAPFGGNKASGVGRSGGIHALHAMTDPKVVNLCS